VFEFRLSGKLNISPFIEAEAVISINKDSFLAMASMTLPLGYDVNIGLSMRKAGSSMSISFYGVYSNGKP